MGLLHQAFIQFPLFVSCATASTITGTIYCDNYFEFYFNGVLIKKDPLTFTPHNAVSVSFEYDDNSTKTYAIMCQDYASDSGYEYISTSSPKLGDGALIASFSDGTVTSSSWKKFVAVYGPTDASVEAGCDSSNLDKCAVTADSTPNNWYSTTYDDSGSDWEASTVYTADEAGWGRTPTWSSSDGCCQPTSPFTKEDLGCCSCNNDGTESGFTTVTMVESECLDPKAELESTSASFIWGKVLEYDNKVLFRYTAAAGSSGSSDSSSSDSSSSDSSSSGSNTVSSVIKSAAPTLIVSMIALFTLPNLHLV